MNAGGKKAVLWGTALDNLASWRMVTPDARVARGRAPRPQPRQDPRRRRSRASASRATTPTARTLTARRRCSRCRAALPQGGPRQGRDRQVARRACPACRRKAATASSPQATLHPAPHAAGTCARCASNSSATCAKPCRRSSRSSDYLDAQPGGAMLAGLEHLDERYVKAVGYATKAQRRGRPKMVLHRRHRRRRRERGGARPPRTSCASPTRATAKASSRSSPEQRKKFWLDRARTAAISQAHQRLQDQRGRGDPARRASATTPTASSASTSSSRSRTS